MKVLKIVFRDIRKVRIVVLTAFNNTTRQVLYLICHRRMANLGGISSQSEDTNAELSMN